MKAEINDSNRQRFFTLYWGQGKDVLFVDQIELKPLTQISDEDAIQVAVQNRFKGNKDVFAKVGREILNQIFGIENPQFCMPYESADYLRSKGYALPWLGLSVEEIIEAGWIKLKS